MPSIIKTFFATLVGYGRRIGRLLDNRSAITDLVSLLVITFGVILVVAGLSLAIGGPSVQTQGNQPGLTSNAAVSMVALIPGIPFYIGDLSQCSLATLGIVFWVLGIDFLLVGLGLWVRHELARFAMIAVFLVATFFQFIQFLLAGFAGSPGAILEAALSAFISYLLLSKFDSLGAGGIRDMFKVG